VSIAASVRGNRLELEVADDGPGAELAMVEKSPGFGLRTVRQRLETRFPGAATFRVRTGPGQGFVVNLSLPLDTPASL
jgi:signal transduction histidine kinase